MSGDLARQSWAAISLRRRVVHIWYIELPMVRDEVIHSGPIRPFCKHGKQGWVQFTDQKSLSRSHSPISSYFTRRLGLVEIETRLWIVERMKQLGHTSWFPETGHCLMIAIRFLHTMNKWVEATTDSNNLGSIDIWLFRISLRGVSQVVVS